MMRLGIPSLAILVSLVLSVAASAAVTVVFSPGEVSTSDLASDQGAQVGILIQGLPADDNKPLGASFHLVFDKSKYDIPKDSVQWDANIFDGASFTPPEDRDDGLMIQAARFNATGAVDPGQAVVTFRIKSKAGANPQAGAVIVSFNTDDPLNKVAKTADQSYPVETWGTLKVSAGPPNPARLSPDGFNFAPRQKDPVTGEVSWSVGRASAFQFQYNDGSGWKAVTGTVNIAARKATLTWPSGITGTKSINLRARAIDQGKVWDGKAVVDADNRGWVEASAPIVVDNEAPRLIGASGSGTTVNLTFQANEVLDATSAGNKDNYVVEDQGAIPSQTTIALTKAEKVGDNQVRLTLAAALVEGHRYKVTANNIADAVGNVMASGSKTFDVLPKPVVQAAAFVRDGTNKTVDVTFSKEMKDAAPLTSADKWRVEEKVAGITSAQVVVIPVASVALQTDKKTVRLTLSDSVKQNSKYEVTAPEGAQDVDGKPLEAADSKAVFETPFWHTFARGLRMLGVPLTAAGRAVEVLNAKAVAHYDGAQERYVVDRPGQTAAQVNGRVDLEIGRGYFARYDENTTVYFDAQNVRGNVTLNVPQGWSIVTNPYVTAVGADQNIEIGQLELGGKPVRFAWHYNGTEWELVYIKPGVLNAKTNVLNPWKGYFIKAPEAGTLTISRVGASAVDTIALPDLGKKATLIQVVAKAGNAADTANVCGVGAAAVQVDNPPVGIAPLDLYFVGADAKPMAVDVRTGAVAGKWEMVLTTSLPNTEVTVFSPDLSSVPPDYAVILTDQETGKKAYLRTSAGYTFTSGADGATRRLVLEIVPRAQCVLLYGVSVQQAGASGVVVTYQLNGPASVSAEILNIAGRPVRRLVTNRSETAGTHTLSWNLTNSAGSPVPRGTYLMVLEARTEDGQQTKAVRPFSVNR
jgi:hypothetical protein